MTTNKEALDYDRPPITIDLPNNRLFIRASQASSCRRQLAYHARNYKITNPPDDIAINRMLAGTLLETVALDYLKRQGWLDVISFMDDLPEEDRPNLRIPLTDNIVITGNPDASGRHPDHTNDRTTVIEVKTRGGPAWYQMNKLGPLGAFPSAIAQLAFYRKGLIEKQASRSHPYIHPNSNGVLVNLNTDTKEVKIYTTSDFNLATTLTDLTARLSTLASNLLKQNNPEHLPPRDYNKEDWQCRFCPFFLECYKGEVPTTVKTDATKTVIPRTDAINALHSYEEASATLQVDADNKKQQTEARETLLEYLQGEQLTETSIVGATGQNKKVKIHKREKTIVDLDKLSKLLSPKDYKEVVRLDTTEYIRVT